jgi:ABC-2 type transport system ATP-binding protein
MPVDYSTVDQTVRVSGLKKRFGDFTAVGGVDFEVGRGEIFGFLGPNGSGKTTTIRMMLGLMKPTAGSIEVLDISVIRHPEKVRPRTGYMAQQFSLYRDLTVRQNLRFHGTAYGLGNRELVERIAEVLALIGLEDRPHTKTEDLSGGWRQRLALGAAILHRPEVLFLDEPTAGVDPISRRAFWELLYRSADQGVTIFVTTHYMDEAEHCHRLAFIRHGLIIASGTPDRLRREIMTETVLELAPDDAGAAMRVLREAQQAGRLQVSGIEMYGSLVHVLAPDVRRQRGRIRRTLRRAGLNPGSDAIIEPSLEDVFIASMR